MAKAKNTVKAVLALSEERHDNFHAVKNILIIKL